MNTKTTQDLLGYRPKYTAILRPENFWETYKTNFVPILALSFLISPRQDFSQEKGWSPPTPTPAPPKKIH